MTRPRLDRTNATHWVYRCYDKDGRLIYVGSTADLFGRLESHRRTSWWSGQTVKVVAKVYASGTIARQYERVAIRTEDPRWNKAGRWATHDEWSRDQWDDWLLMLVRRKTYPHEMRKFADLYHHTWGEHPNPVHMAAIEVAEEARREDQERMRQQVVAHQERMEQVRREDELSLRRERKQIKAKAKRLEKKAKAAKRQWREYEQIIGEVSS